MVSKCANPKCRTAFKYFGTGQLFIAKTPNPLNSSWQQQLQWLCEDCTDSFLSVDENNLVAPVNAGQVSNPNTLTPGEKDVLIDCANSACAAIFISPNQGKLFKFNGSRQIHSQSDRVSNSSPQTPDSKEAWYWLCDGCSRHMTVRLVRGHAEAVPIRHSVAA